MHCGGNSEGHVALLLVFIGMGCVEGITVIDVLLLLLLFRRPVRYDNAGRKRKEQEGEEGEYKVKKERKGRKKRTRRRRRGRGGGIGTLSRR